MKQKKLYLVWVEYRMLIAPYTGGGESFYVVTANSREWIDDRIRTIMLKRHRYAEIKSIRIYPKAGEVIV